MSNFTHPEALARVLLAAEEAIRAPDTPLAHLPGWGWAQQRAYRDLVAHPGWREQVRASLPERLRLAFDANVRAGVELRPLTEPRQELPDWHIVAPPPADALRAHYQTAEEEFGVGWEYLAAIHLVESRMGRIRGDSPAGAQGPMQFLPSTWEAYGEGDINDPLDAIRAAARYLVAHGAPEDMAAALYAYNHSDHYVSAIGAYAGVMQSDPRAYRGYYHWRVYYRLETGDVLLEEGYRG
ncbi:MAG: lytic transglycosylase domain-containing protein [Actinomycetota bacterium]|nr:lytic transglycosylase domain-containing protein [Actinomycetota bacterium]